MTIVNEGIDATINSGAHGNYNIAEGDVFNGSIGPGDSEDGINLRPLTIGESYTISVTLDDLSDTTALTLINHTNFHSINYYVTDGVAVTPQADTGWVRDFVVTSPLTIEGNTLSFTFTPLQHTSLAFQVLGDGTAESYSITFETAVIPPAITNGADTVTGSDGDDNFNLLGGNDVFDGAAGNDTVDGGLGDDTLTGGEGADLFIIGSADGADVITDFTSGADKIDLTSQHVAGVSAIEDLTMTETDEGVVIQTLNENQVTVQGVSIADLSNDDFVFLDNIWFGTEGNDKTNGKSGVDLLFGGDGDDDLDGKAGDDSLDGGAGKDKLTGGDGSDILNGGDGNDLLLGDAENDTMDGGNNNDRLHGGDGDDFITGGHVNDKLYGDAGDDVLTGGLGKDDLTGGAGADIFVFNLGSHRDTITDFELGIDHIDLSEHAVVENMSDLLITQNGAHTQISTGGPDVITLLNTDSLLLDVNDFIF